MCGIAGFWTPGGVNAVEAQVAIAAMTAVIHHRGPDDEGAWIDEAAGVALGHRRLSIIDLSQLGHQPMVSASGRYVVSYNGEIYNFAELRSELERSGSRFRGTSDTEVLLAAVDKWGLERALERFNGMFAFALWDRSDRSIAFARDRMGEKPLYYGWLKGTLVFASEIKALREHPAFDAQIDRDAVALFMRYAYIPAPRSIYRGIFKLPAGTLLRISARAPDPAPQPYWSVRSAFESNGHQGNNKTEDQLAGELEMLLDDAIRLRMRSDVPLGAFLSGGVDSSTVVALMQRASSRPVRTFSIGTHDAYYNEAQHASAVAKHLGTEHTEWYVTPAEAMAVIPRIAHIYDEPFGDSSQIPTFLVSELARKAVTVTLSGDGGDELFGGYNRYTWAQRIWKWMAPVPLGARSFLAASVQRVPADSWRRVFDFIGPLTPTRVKQQMPVTKLLKLSELLTADSREAIYQRLVSHWKQPLSVVTGASEPLVTATDARQWARIDDFASWMMYVDMITYLPDDILVKVDRASMAVSLEARVPLLDHRVVEFAAHLPQAYKVRGNTSKWLLRRILHRYVPRQLVERPKMGFSIPMGDWLKHDLRAWAEALLDERRIKAEGILDSNAVHALWREHVSGVRDWQYNLWDVLMFQAWLEGNHGARSARPAPEPRAVLS